jgi:hypothetical protein
MLCAVLCFRIGGGQSLTVFVYRVGAPEFKVEKDEQQDGSKKQTVIDKLAFFAFFSHCLFASDEL